MLEAQIKQQNEFEHALSEKNSEIVRLERKIRELEAVLIR